MKVCSMCGSQLQDNFNACPNCGNTNLGVMQQPMQNQQMSQQVSGNMPMTYAVVYMVLVGLNVVFSCLSLFTEFNVGTLLGVSFSACVVFFLYKRSKVGRILVMIQNILQMIVGSLVMLGGILFLAGSSLIELDIALSGAFSLIFFIFGGGILAWGICSFIYFQKRACMYIN